MVRGEIDPSLIDEENLGVKCAYPECNNFISGISKYCSKLCAGRHTRFLHPERYREAGKKFQKKEKIRREKEKKKMEDMRMKSNPKYKYQRQLDCPACGSTRTRFSFTDDEMHCGKCGHRYKRPESPKGLEEKNE